VAIDGSRTARRDFLVQQRHPALDVQRRVNAFERETELDERDRHRRPHAGDDGIGIENAGHGGDVADRAPDERVHHVER
jgi:hypothetical protein